MVQKAPLTTEYRTKSYGDRKKKVGVRGPFLFSQMPPRLLPASIAKYSFSGSTAAWAGPASLDEIYSALVAGSFQFESKDATVAKAGLKQSLTKNSAIFHRLPNGAYGLSIWYGRSVEDANEKPKGKSKSKRKSATKKRPKEPSGVRRAEPEKAASDEEIGEPPKVETESPTLLDAVKHAIDAMPVEFTKPDVLKWIAKRYPSLSPRKDSVYVSVTRLREELGLTTAKESKGQEPAVFRKERVGANGSHK